MEEESRESKQFLSFLLLGIGATTGLRGFPQASGEGSETFTAARYTHTRTHTRSEGLATSRGDDAAVSTFRFRGCIFNWQSRAGSQRSTGTDKISLSLVSR